MKQLVQDRMNSFLFLIPFLKSNGEIEFEKHGCSVKKKIHSTKKEVEGSIRNRETASLMFYFPLVQNIYNISYMYRGAPQLESEDAKRKAHSGSRSFHTVSVKPAFRAQQVTMKATKAQAACTHDSEGQHHTHPSGLPRKAKIPFLFNRPIGPPRNKLKPEQRRARARQIPHLARPPPCSLVPLLKKTRGLC